MRFRAEVVAALGRERAQRVSEATNSLAEMADATPDVAHSVAHYPVALKARDLEQARRELEAMIRVARIPGGWTGVILPKEDGSYYALASKFFRHQAPLGSRDSDLAFALSEIHMRLGAWCLTNVWRAAELAEGTCDGLDRWRILVAASCSRSLLEGAAYLAVELPKLVDLWDNFKTKGNPRVEDATAFLDVLYKQSLLLQYATRVGQSKRPKGEKGPTDSASVMKYIRELHKQTDNYDVFDVYEWLCDAVHPSLGSATTFLTYGVIDRIGSHRIERYDRYPLPHIGTSDAPTIELKVAEAACSALLLSSELLGRDLPVVRWILDDLYLTADLQPPPDELHFPFGVQRPDRNAPCPCGSGRKYKRCVHRWGLSGRKPNPE